MKSWPRFWFAAVAVVLLSLAPKIVLGVLRDRAPAATTPDEQLRGFLISASGGPVEPVRAESGANRIAGWRFRSAGCVSQAFLSGLPGVLDYEARAHASNGARILYAYRGALTDRPPAWRLAADVMTFRLVWEFIPKRAQEPRYVVLVYPAACTRPPSLRWDRFRVD